MNLMESPKGSLLGRGTVGIAGAEVAFSGFRGHLLPDSLTVETQLTNGIQGGGHGIYTLNAYFQPFEKAASTSLPDNENL